MKLIIVTLLSLLAASCITTQSADGTTTRTPDPETVRAILHVISEAK